LTRRTARNAGSVCIERGRTDESGLAFRLISAVQSLANVLVIRRPETVRIRRETVAGIFYEIFERLPVEWMYNSTVSSYGTCVQSSFSNEIFSPV
jgi:hypothetical protein